MTLFGNDPAQAALLDAIDAPAMHHAWLLAGPEGVGKATLARAAAARLLTRAAPGVPVAALIAAGSHPDYRELTRLPKDPDKPGQDLARSIRIAQVRALQPLFATKPTYGGARVVVIDAADDLEREGANALLKNLEEPPAGTVFLLVSHAPGRLLPTIRSRCRVARFAALDEGAMRAALAAVLPDAEAAEHTALLAIGQGSVGRAMRFAGLEVAGLTDTLAAIARDGDPSNARRSQLARALGAKTAQPRYEAFLDQTPTFLAAAARQRHGERLRVALDAYAEARELAGAALGLSLDPQATTFEMAGIVARLAG